MNREKTIIKEVGKIDKDAARYLRGDAQKLSSFNREGWLGSVMIWSGTPQGYQYWADLNDKLNLAERGKPMKENKKVYPKKVYILWGYDTNDDRSLTAHEKIEDTSGYRHERVIAIYELKKLVKVEMRPHVRDVKEQPMAVKFYCEVCKKSQPIIIEPFTVDELNEDKSWGDIICSACRLVIATCTVDEPGQYDFIKVSFITYKLPY